MPTSLQHPCPMCGQPVQFARGLCSEECLHDWQMMMDASAGESVEDQDGDDAALAEVCGTPRED